MTSDSETGAILMQRSSSRSVCAKVVIDSGYAVVERAQSEPHIINEFIAIKQCSELYQTSQICDTQCRFT